MLHKKVEKREILRPVHMKKRTSLWNTSGMQHRKRAHPVDTLPGAALPAQCQTQSDPPERVLGLDHRRRRWEHCVCSAPKRESYRGTYPSSAAAWWEWTQTVLKGAQRRREGRGGIGQSCNMENSGSIQGEKSFYCQGGETLEQEQRGSAGPPSLETIKTVLCMALSNLIQRDLIWAAGWTRWPPEPPSNLHDSLISSCYLCFSGTKNWCLFASPYPQQQVIQTWARQ